MGKIDEVIEEHGGWPDAFVTDADSEPEELDELPTAAEPEQAVYDAGN